MLSSKDCGTAYAMPPAFGEISIVDSLAGTASEAVCAPMRKVLDTLGAKVDDVSAVVLGQGRTAAERKRIKSCSNYRRGAAVQAARTNSNLRGRGI